MKRQLLMKRQLDWFSLVVGSTFVLVALLFMADQARWVHLDLAFVGPLLLIAFGVGSVVNSFRKKQADQPPQ